jgi:hypothetical protein
MSLSPARACSRCGEPASYLVAGSDETQAPGPLLVYCDRCRSNAAEARDLASLSTAADVLFSADIQSCFVDRPQSRQRNGNR